MNAENDAKLCEAFPLLYADRHGDPHHTLMCWGFCCGDGWFTLLWGLSEELEALIREQPEADQRLICAMQVKEKFGGLRFYMKASTPAMNEAIARAEDKSRSICEDCGDPVTGGPVNVRGLVSTVCLEHYAKRLAQRNELLGPEKVRGGNQ